MKSFSYNRQNKNYRVAIVDDDSIQLRLIREILSKDGIRLVPLNSGKTLLEYLKVQTPDLILLDIMMPEMDGFETLRRVREHEKEAKIPQIPAIFLTGKDEESLETKGLELGAMDFIRKPFNPKVLELRVSHTLELIYLQRNLESEVEKKTRENERLSIQIVETLAEAIDAKDTYTNGHSGRVARYAAEIARRYGYDEDGQNNIYMMGLLHDVGKIGIPDTIINKPAKLTDEEYETIKNHPVMGARILKNITEMPELVTGARWHHERYDGTGYPDRLKGEEIPEEARIIAVADAYDAMSSRRSYRKPVSQAYLQAEIENGRGTQFDPVFADIMLEMIEEDTEYKMREY